ncbi:phospholipase D-like domain-containing protein [Candidatus Bipolaricaulota bacterium]
MKRLLLSFFLTAVIGLSCLGGTCEVDAFFSSPYVDNEIESRIVAAIDAAQSLLLIALYSFTDDQLGAAVVSAAHRGVDVYVLLDAGQDSDSGESEYPNLLTARIPVGVEYYSGLLHHKFAVIDDTVVITGSYDWTDSADDSNFENVVFITCEEIAADFTAEFGYMSNTLLHRGWPVAGFGG